jgi:hypothetical protein
MILYRLGRLDEAALELTAPSDGAGPVRQDQSLQRFAFLALAQQRIGNRAAAHATLDELHELRASAKERLGADTLAVLSEVERIFADAPQEKEH